MGDDALAVCNLHLTPFHKWGRRIDDLGFGSLRHELKQAIYATASPGPLRTIGTGDFNNREVPLHDAFPGLRISDPFREALTTRSTMLGVRDAQSGHILLSNDLDVAGTHESWTSSDHAALMADVNCRPT